MSKLADQLRSKGIHNDYAIIKKGNPMVYVRSSAPREVYPPSVVLSVKGRSFKGAAWYEHGAKWFSYSGKERREEAKKAAFTWVEKLFPGMKMVLSPFGRFAWVPEEDLEAAKALLKESSQATIPI